MTTSTWTTRELPILQAIYTHSENHDAAPVNDTETLWQLTPELDHLGTGLRDRSLLHLIDADYIGADATPSWQGPTIVKSIRLTTKGLRAVGAWPDGPTDDLLLQLIDRQLQREDDPDRISILQRLRALAGDASNAATIFTTLVQLGAAVS